MQNPIKWIRSWKSETKRIWFLSLVFSSWLMSVNGMVNPLDTWTLDDFLLYPIQLLIVGAILLLPISFALDIIERLINWIKGTEEKNK